MVTGIYGRLWWAEIQNNLEVIENILQRHLLRSLHLVCFCHLRTDVHNRPQYACLLFPMLPDQAPLHVLVTTRISQ